MTSVDGALVLLAGAALLAGLTAARLAWRLARVRAGTHAQVGDLNAALQRFEDTIHAQGQLAERLAQEMRSPLAALLADVQLTRLAPPATGELESFLERTQRDLVHLGQLVDGFVLLARIETQDPGRDLVHVDDVVRAAAARCAVEAECSAVPLELRLEETQSGRDPFVRGDGELLQALVEELLRHAIRRSPGGSAVTVTRTCEGPEVVLVIADRGPGVPEDVGLHVIERGLAAGTRGGRQKGAAPPLAITRAVARLHAGRLGLLRNAAGGCDAVVSLPALPRPEAREALAP